MSKPWYYQVMGTEIGPLTPVELMEKVKVGQIQPDTLVRSGADGKWIPADRWKGLLPAKEEKPTPAPASVKGSAPPKAAATKEVAAPTTASSGTIAIDDEDDPLYHLHGDAAPHTGPAPFSHPDEYDFFQFVGFRHAISPKLYDVVVTYSHQHQMTLTQITRRALAQFIGKPELGDDQPPPAPEAANGEGEESKAEIETETAVG